MRCPPPSDVGLIRLVLAIQCHVGVGWPALTNYGRSQPVVDARQLLAVIAVGELGYSQTLLARLLGRHHGAVSHALQVATHRLSYDQKFRNKHQAIKSEFPQS